MERLWAPWRMAYIEQGEEEGCIFCLELTPSSMEDKLVLCGEKDTLVMLNKFPYNNGHLLIAPRRHVAELADLNPREWWKLSLALKESLSILKAVVNPEGFNLGMNLGASAGAGVAAHLHYHLVPRWKGDTSFMSALADVRVIPEHLKQTYAKLAPHFRDFSQRLKDSC